ncbi:MAG: phage holin family protein [Trueperaceae bacterium]
MNFLLRVVLNAVALWVTAELALGISFSRSGLAEVLLTALVLGLVNTIVRPIMIVLTLPLTLATMGLFLLVVNALALMLVASITPLVVHGFGGAVLGALVLTIISWALARLSVGKSRRFWA